jgi:hypothetical protein
VPSIAALRHAPWSPSKIQCAQRCPLEFHFRYVDKIAEPEVAPETRLGKALHRALEGALSTPPVADAGPTARKDLMSDEERARFDELSVSVGKFVQRVDGFRQRRRVQAELIEHRLAVAFDLSPLEFISRDAFFRGVWDAGYLFDDGLLAVVDHKTGVRRGPADYVDQLHGYALLAAAHVPPMKRVWLGVHFVAEAAMEWAEPVERERIKAEIAPRLVAAIEAAAATVNAGPVPRMSTWCRRCSYKSICPAMRACDGELPEPSPELVDDVMKG